MTRKFEKHTNRGLSNAALKSTLTQHLLQMRVCISLVLSLSIHRSARRTLIECFFKLTRGWTDAGKLQTSRWFAGEIFSFGASTSPPRFNRVSILSTNDLPFIRTTRNLSPPDEVLPKETEIPPFFTKRVDSIGFETFPEFSRPSRLEGEGEGKKFNTRLSPVLIDPWPICGLPDAILKFFFSFFSSFLSSRSKTPGWKRRAIENYTRRYRRNIFNFVGGRLFQESGGEETSRIQTRMCWICRTRSSGPVFRVGYTHSRSDNARSIERTFSKKSHKARHQGANINRIHRAMRQPSGPGREFRPAISSRSIGARCRIHIAKWPLV